MIAGYASGIRNGAPLAMIGTLATVIAREGAATGAALWQVARAFAMAHRMGRKPPQLMLHATRRAMRETKSAGR